MAAIIKVISAEPTPRTSAVLFTLAGRQHLRSRGRMVVKTGEDRAGLQPVAHVQRQKKMRHGRRIG